MMKQLQIDKNKDTGRVCSHISLSFFKKRLNLTLPDYISTTKEALRKNKKTNPYIFLTW